VSAILNSEKSAQVSIFVSGFYLFNQSVCVFSFVLGVVVIEQFDRFFFDGFCLDSFRAFACFVSLYGCILMIISYPLLLD
jgi:hypothetical protein